MKPKKKMVGEKGMYNGLNHFLKFIKFFHSLHGPNQESQENTCIQKDKVNFGSKNKCNSNSSNLKIVLKNSPAPIKDPFANI